MRFETLRRNPDNFATLKKTGLPKQGKVRIPHETAEYFATFKINRGTCSRKNEIKKIQGAQKNEPEIEKLEIGAQKNEPRNLGFFFIGDEILVFFLGSDIFLLPAPISATRKKNPCRFESFFLDAFLVGFFPVALYCFAVENSAKKQIIDLLRNLKKNRGNLCFDAHFLRVLSFFHGQIFCTDRSCFF